MYMYLKLALLQARPHLDHVALLEHSVRVHAGAL